MKDFFNLHNHNNKFNHWYYEIIDDSCRIMSFINFIVKYSLILLVLSLIIYIINGIIHLNIIKN